MGILSPKKVLSNFFGSFLSKDKITVSSKLFNNGDIYHGQLVNGIMNGYGFYQYADGAIYEGEMFKGQRHGLGTYQSISGERYIGEFKSNQRDGRGIKYCRDGTIQDGLWEYGAFIQAVDEFGNEYKNEK